MVVANAQQYRTTDVRFSKKPLLDRFANTTSQPNIFSTETNNFIFEFFFFVGYLNLNM